MSDRLIVCIGCGCVIQQNTPLEKGGTTLPVPAFCDSCADEDEEDEDVLADAARFDALRAGKEKKP